MAKNAKKPVAKKAASTQTKVRRITASDDAPKKPKSTTAKKVAVVAPTKARRKNPFAAIGGYFAGAWYELKQVHWPNRRATWGFTGALIAFTAFFVVVILLLDALFKYLFEVMLG